LSASGKGTPFAEHRVPILLAAFEDTEEAGGAVSGIIGGGIVWARGQSA
jgi:hypothetical protein